MVLRGALELLPAHELTLNSQRNVDAAKTLVDRATEIQQQAGKSIDGLAVTPTEVRQLVGGWRLSMTGRGQRCYSTITQQMERFQCAVQA